MVYVPGVKPRRTNALVSHVDLMPTILELAGAEIPDTVQGQSLASLIKGKTQRARNFTVCTMPLYNPGEGTRVVDNFERRVRDYLPSTLISGPWTMLYTREGAPVELYNMRSDPEQRRNVARRNPKVVERLHRQFVSMLEQLGTEERLLGPRRRL
jgi:arylsulfatase A-like enzyme